MRVERGSLVLVLVTCVVGALVILATGALAAEDEPPPTAPPLIGPVDKEPGKEASAEAGQEPGKQAGGGAPAAAAPIVDAVTLESYGFAIERCEQMLAQAESELAARQAEADEGGAKDGEKPGEKDAAKDGEKPGEKDAAKAGEKDGEQDAAKAGEKDAAKDGAVPPPIADAPARDAAADLLPALGPVVPPPPGGPDEVASIVKAMKPREAAAMVSLWDEGLAADVMRRLQPRVAAPVFGAMTAQKSAAITARLASLRGSP